MYTTKLSVFTSKKIILKIMGKIKVFKIRLFTY